MTEGPGEITAASSGTGLGGTLLSTGLAAAVGALSGIVLARTLGPVERGELATILLWPLAIGILGELGLSWAFSYYAARDESFINGLWTMGWIVSAAWGTLLAAASHLLLGRFLVLSGHAREALAFTIATVPLALATGLQSFLLLGVGALRAFNVVRTVSIFLYAAGVVGIALFGMESVRAYAIAWVVSQVLTFVLATAWFVISRGPRLEWRPALIRPVALYGAKTYASSLTAQMTLRLDQIVMTALGASAVLGVYVVAASVAALTFPLFTALAIVVTHRFQGEAPSGAGPGVIEYLQLTFLLGLPLSMSIAFATPWLVPALFGSAYRGAILPAAILLAAGVFQGANAVLGNGLRALGLPGRPARAEATGFILTIGLLFLLLPRFGATGAAVASLAAYASVTAIQLGFLCRAARLPVRELWSVDFGRLGTDLGALLRRR